MTAFDHILTRSELYDQYSRLGFGPPIWHKTGEFIERINSAVDQTIIETETEQLWLRGEEDRGTAIEALTDPEAFRMVVEEAEECFQNWEKRAKNTQEFDEVIQLLQNIRELLGEHKPVRASMIVDLKGRLWCGRNWECLPEPLNERRMLLDGVLQNVRYAIERPKNSGVDTRSYSLAKAAQAYIANDWMHTPWMTALLAGQMLYDLKSHLKGRRKAWSRWPVPLLVAGGVLAFFSETRTFGTLLCIAGIGAGWASEMGSTEAELNRITDEIESGFYSGRVLAGRLERLNTGWFRCDVPSIVTEVLCK